MSNKGALAVTNLIDEIPGMSGLIFDKEVIPEDDLGYGGLSFKVGNELKYIEYDLFLNFKVLIFSIWIDVKDRYSKSGKNSLIFIKSF